MTEFYFGTRRYRFVNEASETPDSKYIEMLDTSAGHEFLDSLISGETPKQQETPEDKPEEQQETSSIVDPAEVEKAKIHAQAAAELPGTEGAKQ